MFFDVLTAVIEEEKMISIPSFCQLNFISGKSDEAAQVKLASESDNTLASFGS